MARVPLTIPPDVRSRLQRLSLTTRRVAGTRGFGMHASRSKGAGLEFAQYRAYEPGDEPRRIDWKLFSRSDKFFVREAEEESQALDGHAGQAEENADASAKTGAGGDAEHARRNERVAEQVLVGGTGTCQGGTNQQGGGNAGETDVEHDHFDGVGPGALGEVELGEEYPGDGGGGDRVRADEEREQEQCEHGQR